MESSKLQVMTQKRVSELHFGIILNLGLGALKKRIFEGLIEEIERTSYEKNMVSKLSLSKHLHLDSRGGV